MALDRKSPPLHTKGGAPSSSFKVFSLLITDNFLLIFLVDVEDGAVFVEGYVEGFGFLD